MTSCLGLQIERYIRTWGKNILNDITFILMSVFIALLTALSFEEFERKFRFFGRRLGTNVSVSKSGHALSHTSEIMFT